MEITAGFINKIVKYWFSSFPKVTKLYLNILSRKSPNCRCPSTMHQTPRARVPPQSPNKHSQTPKPCPQMALNQKSWGIKRTESPKGAAAPKIRERKPQSLPNTSTLLAIRNNQSPSPQTSKATAPDKKTQASHPS